MELLLDTHVLLWAVEFDRRLSVPAFEAIEDTRNRLYLSAVSLWELAIKLSTGKLQVPGQSVDYLVGLAESHHASILPLSLEHIRRLQSLPWLHRDPFDRTLVSQALVEGFTLVTADAALSRYGIPTLW